MNNSCTTFLTRLRLAACFAVTALLIPELHAAADDSRTIKIVSSLPRTGSANAQTTSIVNGIKLAIMEANNKVGDFSIAYEDWDDASPERGQWDPALEAANADRAIKDSDVVALVGPYNSGASKISMPKLNQAGLAQVSPAATWPGLTKSGIGEPNEPMVYRPASRVTFFRVVPTDDIQGLVAAQWAKDLGAKKVYILQDRELYGKGVAEMFRKSAEKVGIQILGFEGIDPKASNYKSLVTKIKQTAPDIVFFGGTTQTNAGQIVKDLRAGGVTAKYMIPDGCFESAYIIAAGKENAEGTLITFGGVPADRLTGKGKEFYEHFRKAFNAEPEGYAAYGYEAANVVIEGVRRAGKKDRAAILTAISALKNFEGALGIWSFDENGDTSLKTMSGNTVKNGAFEFVKLLGQ